MIIAMSTQLICASSPGPNDVNPFLDIFIFICIVYALVHGHGERMSGFYACNRYEAAKLEEVYDETEIRREMTKNFYLHRLCLGAWTDHGERMSGFYPCNRYEAAKQEGVVRDLGIQLPLSDNPWHIIS
ncbi:hypothetical protein VNO80_01364 [Phaseolus coccineus]|uniref:Uncharacterized protein n=1 Tax=Phaseolus coccineus TaxID=3886 RepID=A0AAN9RST5_PHACN